MPLPPEVLAHQVRHYTPCVISVKVAAMHAAEAELNKDNWMEAFPVREDVLIVAKYL